MCFEFFMIFKIVKINSTQKLEDSYHLYNLYAYEILGRRKIHIVCILLYAIYENRCNEE